MDYAARFFAAFWAKIGDFRTTAVIISYMLFVLTLTLLEKVGLLDPPPEVFWVLLGIAIGAFVTVLGNLTAPPPGAPAVPMQAFLAAIGKDDE